MIFTYITIFILGLYGGFVISLMFDREDTKKTSDESATITFSVINPDGTETTIKGKDLIISTTKPTKDNGPV